jgi:hypothetical protein
MMTAEDLVRREVIYCVSSLIYELSQIQEHLDSESQELLVELGYASGDSEEAASEEGWVKYTLENKEESIFVNEDGTVDRESETWDDLCLEHDIEVPVREVYEHWLITGWFARRLEEKGERVVRDLFGLDWIWGRTTTGQAISIDRVVEEIVQELNNQ